MLGGYVEANKPQKGERPPQEGEPRPQTQYGPEQLTPAISIDLTHAPSHTGGMLIFDGDCGFCTSTARWAESRLPTGTEVVPWQSLDLSTFGLTESDVTTAAYWVDPEGSAHRGHLGVARAAIAMGLPYSLLGYVGLVPPFRWLSAGLYRVVAKHRYRFPGSTDACRLE